MRKKEMQKIIDGLRDEVALKETALQEVNEHYMLQIAELNDQIATLTGLIAHQGGASADEAMRLVGVKS